MEPDGEGLPPADGNTMIDEITKLPNLDFFFDRKPNFSDEELLQLIEVERRNRALFIEKKASK